MHHVNGEGRDGGVVYTEMQGTENHGEVRVTSELNKIMYPGHCGYKSRTGGVMKNLRESTNNEKVCSLSNLFCQFLNLTKYEIRI